MARRALLVCALAAAGCGGGADTHGAVRVEVELEVLAGLVLLDGTSRDGSFGLSGTIADTGAVLDVVRELPEGTVRIERLLSGRKGTLSLRLDVGTHSADRLQGRWAIVASTLGYAGLAGHGTFVEDARTSDPGWVRITGTMTGAVESG